MRVVCMTCSPLRRSRGRAGSCVAAVFVCGCPCWLAPWLACPWGRWFSFCFVMTSPVSAMGNKEPQSMLSFVGEQPKAVCSSLAVCAHFAGHHASVVWCCMWSRRRVVHISPTSPCSLPPQWQEGQHGVRAFRCQMCTVRGTAYQIPCTCLIVTPYCLRGAFGFCGQAACIWVSADTPQCSIVPRFGPVFQAPCGFW
jgi:hypothetical protein